MGSGVHRETLRKAATWRRRSFMGLLAWSSLWQTHNQCSKGRHLRYLLGTYAMSVSKSLETPYKLPNPCNNNNTDYLYPLAEETKYKLCIGHRHPQLAHCLPTDWHTLKIYSTVVYVREFWSYMEFENGGYRVHCSYTFLKWIKVVKPNQ